MPKKRLNTLNKIKNAAIKYKRPIPKQKELLNLFNNLLDTNSTDKTLMSSKEENENENENENEYENGNEDYEHEHENEDDDDDNDETMNQNEIIKNLNGNLDKIIDKSKSFEEQIELLKKIKGLKEYWFIKDFDDKELKFKIFKLKIADMSDEIDKKLFEQIFGHTLMQLADKLINAINKEENQIIVKNILKNKDKLYKRDEFYSFVIRVQQRSDLKYIIDFILNFNETIHLYLVWASIEKI